MHILDSLTATQLAAGATLDRPAAVVRELLDNAIDAGATHISVHVSDGRIVVIDDGCGMSSDELVLAFRRHATSKLRSANDTIGIQTLGFRGEALAALAAVAAISAVSRRVTDPHATEVRYAAGELQDVRACAAPYGTSVTVERLFYTSPHRRTFWRQPIIELQRIADMVGRYALCFPAIAFQGDIAHGERIQTSGSGDLVTAVTELWHEVDLRPVETALGGYPASLTGVVCGPHSGRPLRRRQIVAINRRPIAARGTIAHLIDEVLPPLRQLYPACVLHWSIPDDAIEVNSREGKEDVQVRSPSVIARLLYQAFRSPQRNGPVEPLHVPLPPLSVIGVYQEWFIASGVEGVFVLSPANIMHRCGVTTLPRGDILVPPLPLTPRQRSVMLPHREALAALGIGFSGDDAALCVTAFPQQTRPDLRGAPALTRLCQALQRGATPAQAIGPLLEPTWLIAILRQLPDPWAGNTCMVLSHQRIQHSLRSLAPERSRGGD